MYCSVPRMVPRPVIGALIVGVAPERLYASCGFRETEIQQLRASLRQHHVARLQIAMDDAGAMRLSSADATSTVILSA